MAERALAVRIDSGGILVVSLFDFFFLFGAIASKSQKESIFGFMMVCESPIFREITLVGEDWLHWLISFAGVSCLWLPTCVDKMGWGIHVTVQYMTYWSQ